MRISDWSSDVCSSELLRRKLGPTAGARCSLAPTLYGFVDRFHIRLILGMGRQIVIGLPIQLVTRADLDFIHAVKNVELGERDAGNAAYRRRLAHQHGVEPAAAPLAPGIDAKFSTAFTQ